MKYGVQEFFYTWQGEGVHMGQAAFFIRLYGCPVHCPWCDSAGTWHKAWPTTVKQMLPSELVREYIKATGFHDGENFDEVDAKFTKLPFVVVTGGEPTMYDLEPLVESFHAMGVNVHLETSGSFPIRGDFDWITVSPKWGKLPLKDSLVEADEIKIIVENVDSIKKWEWQIDEIMDGQQFQIPATWWLHPEWSKARERDMAVLNVITEAVKNVDGVYWPGYRAGYQLHKMYAADNLDPNSQKALIPLGGDPDKGY